MLRDRLIYLMGIVDIVVRDPGDHRGVILVFDVYDCQRILVIAEANLLSLIVGIWSLVDYTLGIMNVAILPEASLEFWEEGVSYVDHVQTARTCPRSHGIHVPTLLISNDVMSAGHLVVVCVCFQDVDSRRRRDEGTETRQVENLHSVVGSLANDEGMVCIYLS